MADVSLRHIDKFYDNNVQVVFDFNLEIKDKEFIVIVGPSGCGKSTTLRMIAGLEDISGGELYIDGKFMNDVEPKDRDIAMVFQSYALYPHMSVFDNMAFGLQCKKIPKKEIEKRVREAAHILKIEDCLERKPKALSGGQRQRVALGRAMVCNAKVFLMDEPLSNLDAKLRILMRSEIIKLHEKIGATCIYVTHDQTEAMTMADRIVVMKDGYIQQIGTPREIYNNPANMFVAGFLGAPATNFLKGEINHRCFVIDDKWIELPEIFYDALEAYEGKKIVMGIRPEDFHQKGIVDDAYPVAHFTYEVEIVELLGHEFILHGKFGSQDIKATVPTSVDVKAHETIELTINLKKVHFFDLESEKAIV